MEQPPGYARCGPDKVWLLKKTMYGLRQASRAWYKRLKDVLETAGYQVSSNDPALFHKLNPEAAFASVHVDDILSASASLDEVQDLKSALRKVFDITNMGDVKHYLGMKVLRDRKRRMLKLSQRQGAVELKQYQELMGSLNYLANCTRPDIAQAVGLLSRFLHAPTTEHAAASKSVLRYLAGIKDLWIVYSGSDTIMKGFCDADFAGDLDSMRSTTSYVFLVNGGAVCWGPRLQKTVALSTMEVEFVAFTSGASEGLWLEQLRANYGLSKAPVLIFNDSQSAIAMLKNPIVQSRAKHIDVRYHFVRERVEMQEISVSYNSTKDMMVDIFTKPLPANSFVACRAGMGIK
ncbi:hypothetical protein AXG93_1998s1280 [Marchantia polymorpha subsp. ruderalis]|uniref:Reverse transcriptase Ty1/copia-type domain-containing protein n=1 Tax=Marchantia polymorpha subsp. ruderalis TaxID=1480154 RepID=A0A176VLQ0_MARPO|nr:hypothetical protein AXG93_1998s1280 [Marchantia polymorpha subsp. ruderalis]